MTWMVYMVGKVVLYGIGFDIVYNELGNTNTTTFEYLCFTEFRKNINILKTEMEGHKPALCCYTYTYIYQIELFKFRLLFRTA